MLTYSCIATKPVDVEWRAEAEASEGWVAKSNRIPKGRTGKESYNDAAACNCGEHDELIVKVQRKRMAKDFSIGAQSSFDEQDTRCAGDRDRQDKQ